MIQVSVQRYSSFYTFGLEIKRCGRKETYAASTCTQQQSQKNVKSVLAEYQRQEYNKNAPTYLVHVAVEWMLAGMESVCG